MALGQALVEELSLDPGVDTLGRWMAHYIAELIRSAEAAEGEERATELSKCADAILRLWEHRHVLPNGRRPFEEMDAILRALESLDPDDDTPRYFRSQRMAAGQSVQNDETMEWLKLVDGLDYSARILIRYCLTRAAETALDQSRDWVALAKAAEVEDGIDLTAISVITDEMDLLETSKPDEAIRAKLEDRINRLEGFKGMVDFLVSNLQLQLVRLG